MYPGRFYVLYPAVGVIGALILRAQTDDASGAPAFIVLSVAAVATGVGFGGWVAWIGDRKRTDGRKRPEGWMGAFFASWPLGMMIERLLGDSDVLLWSFAMLMVSASAGFILIATFRLLRGDFKTSKAA